MAKDTQQAPELSHRRVLRGTVVRRSGDKTVSVEVTRVAAHELYHKRRQVTKRYLAHDPRNEYAVGDVVSIQEARPLSARKRWMVISKQA